MLNSDKINQTLINQSHRVLAVMLLALHAFLVWGDESHNLHRTFFLCHYGIFLLWQPLWRSADKLSIKSLAFFIIFGWLGFVFINWWYTAAWLAILFGLLGGRIFSEDSKPNRVVNILAAIYLLAMLLLWVVPKLLGVSHDLEAAEFAITYLVPILPLSILAINTTSIKAGQLPILDFFYTLLLTLIAMILILASYAIGNIQPSNYLQTLFISIFGIAFLLLAFSLMWKPSTRFSGVELIMSRYLLSIGMPFEKWVKNIATLGEVESHPEGFLQNAMKEMLTLPWVTGVSWLADDSQGKLGASSDHKTDFNYKDFHMTLHTRWQVSPALYVHVKLLTQILGEFYIAKRREETMRQNAYMQAFYESGSRLTHDIKNILQSVGTLVSAAEQTDEKDNEALVKLIRRQLPMLNQRIGATLDKLKAPGEEKKRLEKMSAWWKNLQLRHQQAEIDFTAETLPVIDINAEVLDSILDNLLSNAIEKAKYQPNVQIKVNVYKSDQGLFLVDVTDTGKAMDQEVANHLFKKHIASHNGMGVGLYHAGLDAKQAGYELDLVKNINGEVCFRVTLSH